MYDLGKINETSIETRSSIIEGQQNVDDVIDKYLNYCFALGPQNKIASLFLIEQARKSPGFMRGFMAAMNLVEVIEEQKQINALEDMVK